MKFAYVVGNDNPKDPDPDLDIPFAIKSAQELSISLDFVNWHDQTVDWATYDAAIIRSTWDYVPIREEFLEFTRMVETKTRLFNSSKVMQWNTDKTYLNQLEKKGVPIIPTKFVSPKDDQENAINWGFSQSDAIAIKPSVGAGARLAGRATNNQEAKNFLDKIFQAGRTAMIQPYVESVDSEGEFAIVVIDKKISHVARKVPALTQGGHGDAAGDQVITEEIKEIVNIISSAVDEWESLLFARVDVVRLKDRLVLMEIELTEPWLFFQFRPEAAKDLFQALQKAII